LAAPRLTQATADIRLAIAKPQTRESKAQKKLHLQLPHWEHTEHHAKPINLKIP
jgi:hypothetical protein